MSVKRKAVCTAMPGSRKAVCPAMSGGRKSKEGSMEARGEPVQTNRRTCLPRLVLVILAAHSLGSFGDDVLMLKMSKGDGYSMVRRKIIEGLQNQLGVEGKIKIVQMLHGGYDLNVGHLGHYDGFYGVSGDPVLFRYFVKGMGVPEGIYVKAETGDTFALHPKPSDTVGDVKNMLVGREGILSDEQRLIFEGMHLEDERALSDYEIGEGSTIHLFLRVTGGGFGPVSFADVTDSGSLKKRNFLNDAPKYRIARPGLCLEGRCANRLCPAFGKMGILNNGFQDYDLAHGATKPCSQCHDDVMPTTCAFNNCMWRYEGQKAGEGHTVVGPWTEADNAYHRFEEGKGVEWKRLFLQVRRVQPQLTVAKKASPSVRIDHTYNSCTQCLGPVGSGKGTLLGCGHSFHTECIVDWELESVVVCPICRKESPRGKGRF